MTQPQIVRELFECPLSQVDGAEQLAAALRVENDFVPAGGVHLSVPEERPPLERRQRPCDCALGESEQGLRARTTGTAAPDLNEAVGVAEREQSAVTAQSDRVYRRSVADDAQLDSGRGRPHPHRSVGATAHEYPAIRRPGKCVDI